MKKSQMGLDFTEGTGQERKEVGMSLAASAAPNALTVARGYALEHCMRNGQVTIDDVTAALIKDGVELGNYLGSVFKGKRWKCIGFTKSKRPERHSGLIRIWTIVPGFKKGK